MAGSGGQVWPARDTETQSDQCPLGAGVCEVLKLKSLIRESSRYVFPAWWSLFFGAAGLDSGALFKCLLLFDLLTELHRGSSEWKHKIVQNQGNHIRTRQEKGKLFLDIFCHLFFINMYCLLFPFPFPVPFLYTGAWHFWQCHACVCACVRDIIQWRVLRAS